MSKKIRRMFSRISPEYDFMNHLLSMGIDRKWRNEAANEAIISKKAYRLLDAATGTGDFAIEISKLASHNTKDVRIEGMDFVPEMVAKAKSKTKLLGIDTINFKVGDVTRSGYRNESFNVVTSAFSLRNLDDLAYFLTEMRRVLKKRGKIVLLEMARPDNEIQRLFFSVYSHFIKLAGMFVDKEAYSWLVSSIEEFDKNELVREMKVVGFRNIRIRTLFPVAFIAVGEK
ncbi:MAG: ubiquinone/menaquinone biosynthesis methyltransferase [Candidatus Micrarchaeales archaeon]